MNGQRKNTAKESVYFAMSIMQEKTPNHQIKLMPNQFILGDPDDHPDRIEGISARQTPVILSAAEASRAGLQC
ncbi:MAG: hypothetical protein ACP5D0_10235 [Hydrogenovibrio sp.]